MEKIESSLFKSLPLPESAKISLNENILSITKWNWDFQECESFQMLCAEFISKNRSLKIYIFTNHPHCFTLGRGNERGESSLISFDKNIISNLEYPIHKIHRGGGITFHYPGQWIFYPICSINGNYTLDDHMCWMLKSVKEVLHQSYSIDNALSAKKLMGIWIERKKIASIGVGLKRFVSIHGLALNLETDLKMMKEIKKINPCGLNPDIYIYLDEIRSEQGLVEDFHENYIKSDR